MSDQLPATTGEAFADAAEKHHVPQTRVEGGYLSFNGKSGAWFMGTDETEVDGAHILINSRMIQHGWIRWGTKPPAKIFARIADGPLTNIPQPDAVEGIDADGRSCMFTAGTARQFSGAFVGEEDAELGAFIFNTNSGGGVENTDKLYAEIIVKARSGSEFWFPVCELSEESYKRSTGKVYKPVFTIVSWCNADGAPEGEEKKKLADKTDKTEEDEGGGKKSRRRRRRA